MVKMDYLALQAQQVQLVPQDRVALVDRQAQLVPQDLPEQMEPIAAVLHLLAKEL
jgi:hypothetical protein